MITAPPVIVCSPRDPVLERVIARLRTGRGSDVCDTRKDHVCDRQLCDPQSETQMVETGKISPPALTSNVYLCRFGKVHLCTEDMCEYYGDSATRTCHISGQHMGGSLTSTYSQGDSRTWYAPAPTAVSSSVRVEKPRTPRHRRPVAEIDVRAENLVKLLLFSRNRIHRNEEAIALYNQQAKEARVHYLKTRREEKQLPYDTDLRRITTHFLQQPLPLRIWPYDEDRTSYYSGVVCQKWEMVVKHYQTQGLVATHRVDFDCVALGVLYKMCTGIIYNGQVILPCDEFLKDNLPCIGDLNTYFGIDCGRITKGDNILMAAYQNAIHKDGANASIAVNATQLAVERPDRPQGEVHLLHEDREDSVRYRFTSSKTKIFMPVSRKKPH